MISEMDFFPTHALFNFFMIHLFLKVSKQKILDVGMY